MKALVNVRLVQPQALVEDGILLFEHETILYAGPAEGLVLPTGTERIDGRGNYLMPGFVDIHCHGGDGVRCEEDPVRMAAHHLRHGTTSLLCSIGYGLQFEEYLAAIGTIREAAEKRRPGNIAGIHMEAPYISPKYGARSAGREVYPVVREEYEAFIAAGGGLIRQWTFSPELEDLDDFVDTIVRHGIAPAMGHSEAGPAEVDRYCRKGARIVTHLFDATGCSVQGKRFGGTRDPWLDECCMVYDDMYVEVIPDSLGAHVRPIMAKLALRTMGEDHVCVITDAAALSAEPGGPDIHINEQGELSGSRMTMDGACRNMQRYTGADMRVLGKLSATNPARAVGLADTVGSLTAGKRADMLLVDERLTVLEVFLRGERVERQPPI